jgi:hypothetical protein
MEIIQIFQNKQNQFHVQLKIQRLEIIIKFSVSEWYLTIIIPFLPEYIFWIVICCLSLVFFCSYQFKDYDLFSMSKKEGVISVIVVSALIWSRKNENKMYMSLVKWLLNRSNKIIFVRWIFKVLFSLFFFLFYSFCQLHCTFFFLLFFSRHLLTITINELNDWISKQYERKACYKWRERENKKFLKAFYYKEKRKKKNQVRRILKRNERVFKKKHSFLSNQIICLYNINRTKQIKKKESRLNWIFDFY